METHRQVVHCGKSLPIHVLEKFLVLSAKQLVTKGTSEPDRFRIAFFQRMNKQFFLSATITSYVTACFRTSDFEVTTHLAT